MEVKCPRCGKPSLFTPENPNRPFCSERCKLIDLGQWAEGKYAIPVEEESDESFTESTSPETPSDNESSPDRSRN